MLATHAYGQCAWQSFEAFNPDIQEDLGRAVAVGPGMLVVGAPGIDSDFEGTARIFRRSGGGWSLQTTRHSGELDALNLFGTSAAMDGNRFIVGDPQGQEGTVHVYRVEGGAVMFEQRISSLEVTGQGYFGRDVALSGDAMLVGARWLTIAGQVEAGAAHVFRRLRGTWTPEQELTAPVPMSSDFFGRDVAIAGDVALVGATGVNGPHTTTGAAFVFRRERGVWNLEQTLVPTDPATGSKYFGNAVAIDGTGTTIAIGAERTAGNKGAVHLYTYDGASWQLQKILLPSAAASTAHFGGDVALSADGQTLVVGAYSDFSVAPAAGAVYVYRLVDGVWQEDFMFAAADGECIGASVAIFGDLVVVGDPCFADFSGRVHVLAGIEVVDCNGNGVNDGCDVVSGFSADVDQDGVPDECRRSESSPDINGDGMVDATDLGLLLGAWGECASDGMDLCAADLDGDGAVTGADLGVLLSAWGRADSTATCDSGSDAPCCDAHETPGCDDAACCEAICAVDPFCCQSHWDAICVSAARTACDCPLPAGCGDSSAGDCCLPSQLIPGSPGCSDAACCELICDFVDPFCCDVEWDVSCATWALQFCQPCPPVWCGLGVNDCCTFTHPVQPGCNDLDCCTLICGMDAFCCTAGWDFFCTVLADANCAVCAEAPPP